MGFQKVFLVLTLAALFSSTVQATHAQAEVVLDPQVLDLQRGEQGAVMLHYFNNSSERVGISASATPSTDELEAILLENDFVLNDGERTAFSLVVKASNTIANGTYTVTIVSHFREIQKTISKTLTVKIEGNDRISLTPVNNGQKICREGYHKNLEVKVKNNTEHAAPRANITLFSETDLFLPSFEPPNISLGAGEEKTVVLTINFNDFTQFGEYSIPVFAKVNGKIVAQRDFDFEIVECFDEDRVSFELSVERDYLTMDKFEEKRVSFTLTNFRDEVQEISFSAVSDLAVREGQFFFTLGPHESQESFIEIETKKIDEPKTHRIELFAWSEFGKEKEVVRVRVKEEHNVRARLLQDDLTSQICSAAQIAVFELELSNEGDTDEIVKLSVDNDYETIGVTFPKEVELKEGEKKIVNVVISPSFDTKLGEKEITLKLRGKGIREELPLRFTVVEAAIVLPKATLKVVSAPAKINVLAGEEKTINVKIENPTETTVSNLVSRVRGLDKTQLVFSQESISVLGPGESASIDMKLKVSESAATRTYDLTLEIFSENGFVSTPFRVTVKAAPKAIETKEKGPLIGVIGLFSLADPLGGGIVLLTIILIIAAGIILVYLLNSSNKKTVVWESYQKKPF